MRGQGAIMDAMLFMLIASAGAGLLIYTTSLFGTNTNKEIIAVYNYEYMSNALIALHYAKDNDGQWFWNSLKDHIESGDAAAYFSGPAKDVWASLNESSPSKYTAFCWDYRSSEECYPYSADEIADIKSKSGTILSSSIKMDPLVTVYLRLYY